MRELNIKAIVSIVILVSILVIGWQLNKTTSRTYSERKIQMHQLNTDLNEMHPDWQNELAEHYIRPFGPREYIRIYPRNP